MKIEHISRLLVLLLVCVSVGYSAEYPNDEHFKQARKFTTLVNYIDRYYVDEVDKSELLGFAYQGIIDAVDSADCRIPLDEFETEIQKLAKVEGSSLIKMNGRFVDLLSYVEQVLVDSLTSELVTESAIVGMLNKLDPHSIYIPKKEVDAMNAPLKGNFEGVGVRFQIMVDTILVVNPIPGGPSEKVGILAGDKFIEVDGEKVAGIGISNSGVRDRLLGNKGTIVKVKMLREGEGLLDFVIERDKIPIYSMDASFMVAPNVGYIKLNNFSATTIEEFEKGLKKLRGEGMKDLVLDLQGNGGGYLITAIDLADHFLKDPRLVVYTKGRSANRKDYETRKHDAFEEGRLIVLVDESSASASEIVSGAIQDWDRGLVVGRRSFGKGLVQRPVPLPDGSSVRLTMSRYYTPSGRCIQKSYKDGTDAYRKEKYTRRITGEAFSSDSIAIVDSLKFTTRINSRVVYGGGGITPDVFVPLDTTNSSKYFGQLLRKGVFSNFALKYVNKNREALAADYPYFKDFMANFDPESLIDKFIAEGEKSELEFDEEGYEKAKQLIHVRLKADIAQDMWGGEKFYETISSLNTALQKAIYILQEDMYQKYRLATN